MYRFGFIDNRVFKLDEIGNIYHLSGEEIWQIVSCAIRKLRDYKFLIEFNPRYEYRLRLSNKKH